MTYYLLNNSVYQCIVTIYIVQREMDWMSAHYVAMKIIKKCPRCPKLERHLMTSLKWDEIIQKKKGKSRGCVSRSKLCEYYSYAI